ncbi:MAG: YfiR family protein [Desulfamplus sp.]|nr:YfiR family protein [Desulfamplus sp.]
MMISAIKKTLLLSLLFYAFSNMPLSISQNLFCFSSLYAQEPSKQEIQAAMIIKFTDFIEWTSHSFDENAEEFVIAIMGENEYEGLFEPFKKRLFYGKKLKIVHFADVENIYADIDNLGKIQILIVNKSEKKRIKQILDKLKGKPVLTIGDFPEFALNGGIINFFRKANNRIGFEINMEAKNLSGIKISSHLLKLGKIVVEQNGSSLKSQKR